MDSSRLLSVVFVGTLLSACGATRASDQLPNPGQGPADLVATWVPVDGIDDLVQLELSRANERVLVDKAWSTQFGFEAAWSDGAAGPVLWVQSADIGDIAFDLAEFPAVRRLDCLHERSEFELLAASQLPEALDEVTCR